MKTHQRIALVSSLIASLACGSVLAQDARKELRRVDLSGAPGMEVILSISEYKKGESLSLHFHHGVEAGYVLDGGMVQVPGKDPTELKTGNPIMNARDVAHAGWTVVSDNTIRILTVHVVDKGKPLYDTPRK